jgi:uncharacterized protein
VSRRSAPVHSALYEGRVIHVRRGAVRHRFSAPTAMCYLDLDELDAVLSQHPLWSTGRWRSVQVRRNDYGGDCGLPLKDALHHEGARVANGGLGPVRLLAHPRTWGWCFNPLSLGFCFEQTGEDVAAVVATVTNTPWGERHDYVLPACAGKVDTTVQKALHVSPFFSMAQTYHFSISRPAERLQVNVEVEEEGKPVLWAGLSLRRRPLDRWAMTELLVRHPAMTWRVTAGIYLQAARLAAKGASFHRHPSKAPFAHPPSGRCAIGTGGRR